MIIYMFINKLNGKKYVGLTTRSLKERTQGHMRGNKTLFDRKLKQYGIENFDLIVLDVANTIEELNEKEKYYIKAFKTLIPDGYNLCEGGGVTKGFKHTDESKRKMSVSKKGKYAGQNNHFYKKHHSEETREKMRDAWTDERKAKLSEEAKNRRHHTVKVRNVETGEVFNSILEAANKYNIKPTHITRVCKGKRKTTGGYHWEYAT